MKKQSYSGLKRIVKALGYSIAGLKAAYKHEQAFRQECFLSMFMIPAAFFLGKEIEHKALLITSCLIVMIVELINSAIEAVVDRIGHEHHELSARAKDIGSAAVFISLFLCSIIWILFIYKRIFNV